MAAKKPAAKKAAPKKKKAAPAEEHGRVGDFVDIVSGPYKGRYGVLESETLFRSRDADNELLAVSQTDTRPAESGRR